MPQLIDRPQLKREVRTLLSSASINPKKLTVLYLMLVLALDMVDTLVPNLISISAVTTFISILTSLMSSILLVGFTLTCMTLCRRQQAAYSNLFDGFSFVGKIICLQIITYFFIYLWSLLFLIPGIVAAYRYRFALYNLCENPSISVFDALNLSKWQSRGYKQQLFLLDLSYLGWGLLASLPMLVEYAISAPQIFQTYTALLTNAPVPDFTLPLLPSWGWLLVTGLWDAVVSVFYLPERICVEYEYFLTAKETNTPPKNPLDFGL